VATSTSNLTLSCTATEVLHLCEAASDCTADTANPKCCAVLNYHVCVPSLDATLGSLTCL